MNEDDVAAYEVLIVAEEEAWARVAKHLPGAPGHDPALWSKWERALEKAEAFLKALHPHFPQLEDCPDPAGSSDSTGR